VDEGMNHYAIKIAMNLQGGSPNTTEQPQKITPIYPISYIIYYVAFTKFGLAYLSHNKIF